jgi:hypothetical protein
MVSDNSPYLFPSERTGRAVPPEALYKALQRAIAETGLPTPPARTMGRMSRFISPLNSEPFRRRVNVRRVIAL